MKRDRSQEAVAEEPAVKRRTGDPGGAATQDPDEAAGLPAGWRACPKVGTPIPRLRIIATKAPLNAKRFERVIGPQDQFTPDQLLQELLVQQKIQVGMVIDLTNTLRYYRQGEDGSDFCYSNEMQAEPVHHLKIRCRGRGQVPEPAAVNQFCWALIDFDAYCRQSQQELWTVVHCTHGFNRTGYMITSALVRLVNKSVQEGLRSFAEHRPPGIYKRHYVQELFKYYHEAMPKGVRFPALPEWKPSEADDEEGDDADGIPEQNPVASAEIQHDDVVGEEVSDAEAATVQAEIMRAIHGPSAEEKLVNFPGSQPVSLALANRDLLRQHRYWVTWKADGTRYMLLILVTGTYLVDRSFAVRRVQMRWPVADSGKLGYHPASMHVKTLMDGEMIVDEDLVSGKRTRRFLVYDLMMLRGERMAAQPFKERWVQIEQGVVAPRAKERAAMIADLSQPADQRRMRSHYLYQEELFSVRRKDFWPLHRAPWVLQSYIPKLSHESDGLILQPWDGTSSMYAAGTCPMLLKWKFAHLNSVDFLLQMDPAAKHGYRLELMAGKGMRSVPEGRVITFETADAARQHNGSIIECTWLPQEGAWSYHRTRTDKATPNAWTVYQKVWQSIQDNITDDKLTEHVKQVLNDNEHDLYTKDLPKPA